MRHFHIITVHNGVQPLSTLRYDVYEDAIETYVRLTTALFGSTVEPQHRSIEYAKQATENGEGEGAFIGCESIALFFLSCEESPCSPPNWN